MFVKKLLYFQFQTITNYHPHPLASFSKMFTLALKIFLSPSSGGGVPLLDDDFFFISRRLYEPLGSDVTKFFENLDSLSLDLLAFFDKLIRLLLL